MAVYEPAYGVALRGADICGQVQTAFAAALAVESTGISFCESPHPTFTFIEQVIQFLPKSFGILLMHNLMLSYVCAKS